MDSESKASSLMITSSNSESRPYSTIFDELGQVHQDLKSSGFIRI